MWRDLGWGRKGFDNLLFLMEINQNTDVLFSQNRAFRYGDGIFETIIFENSALKLWDLHLNRLKKGIEILKFEGVDLIEIENQILAKIQDHSKSYRIRLQLWRIDGGLYTPQTNQTQFFIAVSAYSKHTDIQVLDTDFAKSIYLNYSLISSLKTCNALPYVLASIEKKERNLGEIIILSSDGFLAECSASNLFWIKDNVLFTPSLSTGCVAGVMREHILNQAKTKNFKTEIGEWKPVVLNQADLVFCSNITGLRFLKMDNKNVNHNYAQKIINLAE